MSAEFARYICPACDAEQDINTPLWRCPSCGSHLNLTDGPGLTPDEVVALPDAVIDGTESLTRETDTQLNRAVELLNEELGISAEPSVETSEDAETGENAETSEDTE